MSRFWYAYTGNGDDTNPTNYVRINWNPDATCLGGSTTCTVYSQPNPLNPDIPLTFSKNVRSYLVASKALFDKFPNDGIEKPYVYSRGTL